MTTAPIDRTSDRAAYRQIADRLRERLDAGELRAGDRLPSETELINRYGVSRATARRGLSVLINEGRAQAVQGKGVYVRDAPSAVRLVVSDPVSILTPGSASDTRRSMKEDAEDQGFGYRVDVVARERVPAPRAVAAALDIPVGTIVFARRRIVSLRRPGEHGFHRAKIADSFFPLDIASDRIREETTGLRGVHGAILDDGHRLSHFTESVVFRMPRLAEARELRLDAGVPVIEQTRVAFSAGRPIECFLAVMAGDWYELEYRIDAS